MIVHTGSGTPPVGGGSSVASTSGVVPSALSPATTASSTSAVAVLGLGRLPVDDGVRRAPPRAAAESSAPFPDRRVGSETRTPSRPTGPRSASAVRPENTGAASSISAASWRTDSTPRSCPRRAASSAATIQSVWAVPGAVTFRASALTRPSRLVVVPSTSA